MSILDKQGYRISIDGWVGKLGNHLIQLSCALNVAKKTQSHLTIPDHPILNRKAFDFTNRENENCYETVEGRFFFKSDCFQYPLEFDSDRRRVFQDHVLDLLVRKSVRDRVAAAVNRNSPESLSSGTLVINVRSGRDIFRSDPPPLKDYMQLPLSYYKHIIESNSYDDCLIVTEPARANPCIDALVSWNPNIRIKRHESVKDDLTTILGATNLVMCHSTFSWCLALMSRNLRKLYQPHTFQIRGVGAFSTDTYSFGNYIMPGEWKCSPEQLELMVNHSSADLAVLHKPAGGEASSEPERSNFW
jgi:hypothetical protein